MAPGDFVIVDQFIDRTFARAKSFFGAGCVAHVSVAHPVCGWLVVQVADVVFPALGLTSTLGIAFGLGVFGVIYLPTLLLGFVAWLVWPPSA